MACKQEIGLRNMLSLWKKARENFWLASTCADVATFRALKGVSPDLPHAMLRLRGLDAPIVYRPGATDVPVVWELFYGREYECTAGWPFRTVIDCGANVGLFLAWAMREAGGRLEHYVGVEPDPSSFATLALQLDAMKLHGKAKLFQAAVWDKDGSVSFDDDGPSWGHTVRETGTRQVRACSMTTILDEAGIERADLVKIDIEGGERTVLETLGTWADRVDAIVVELHDGLDDEWFASKVCPHGFHAYATGKLFRDHPSAVRAGSALAQRVSAPPLKQAATRTSTSALAPIAMTFLCGAASPEIAELARAGEVASELPTSAPVEPPRNKPSTRVGAKVPRL